ncbi:rod shape-determining protein RodA [Galbibacter pacificus]|uniref:Rod shape-determining protein RodA n=1 Tax=Galbibacter pacificus TaxID=2996052 RepID=A0ABT6FW41_9FLAO|nr:rod shape-determining protein RodA [Galbibacter pacificus]MDG3584074.1 rod shape-determining protein RodA [Galbibacter pacificus]MDG3587493.1 rod shape-determining protein RodA [Galbibacter pacificus]
MSNFLKKIDWLSILIYFFLVFIGWLNIYSASYSGETSSIFNTDAFYGKQLFFIGASLVLIILVLSVEAKFYERFSGVIYLISLLSLAGLFLFGKNVNGATSWYAMGGMTLQPSEFAKAATALALAKFLCDIQTDIHNIKDLFRAFVIISIPALLIIPQPDPGSALVYAAFFFVLYREGLPASYLLIGVFAVILFVSTLIYGTIWVFIGAAILLAITYFISKKRKKKVSVFKLILILITTCLFSYSVDFIYNNVFEQRHRDRFGLWLRLEKDPVKLEQIRKTIGYNTYQSESAIGSGGFIGKGFLEGTRTKGNFVPEQHTDYIFSTVGEEWGFIGSALVVVLFTLLILRLIIVAERQKSAFSRIYGYSVASIIFFHFAINIGMVIGLLPTVGIPLPFFSYGGSGLLGFTLLLFIFIKLDANRINEW